MGARAVQRGLYSLYLLVPGVEWVLYEVPSEFFFISFFCKSSGRERETEMKERGKKSNAFSPCFSHLKPQNLIRSPTTACPCAPSGGAPAASGSP